MQPKKRKLIQNYPKLNEIKHAMHQIESFIIKTPVCSYPNDFLPATLQSTKVFCKLELKQKTGSFKPRGALLSMLNIPKKLQKFGVVAASAGNHAIAVSYAAKMLGIAAKVVMPRSASEVKKNLCRHYGAELILEEHIVDVFKTVEKIHLDEARTIIHPFEGPLVALGTATLGVELHEQLGNMDAIIIPVGGGGLAAGIAAAIKQLQPDCQIYGVEPEGANGMQKSFLAGKPQSLEKIHTIADSLGVPTILPYSFSLCYRFVDEIVTVSDNAMCKAMNNYFYHLKLAVEPAGAASLAALLGPLSEKLQNKKIALIVSGSNIDATRYCNYING